MAVSNGLLTAICTVPSTMSVGMTECWKATLVEILLRAGGGTSTLAISINGQFKAWASFWRKTSSANPRSRQMNPSNVSCEPLSAATRQALVSSPNCSGSTTPMRLKKSFSDTNAIQRRYRIVVVITRQIRKSCGLWSKLFTNEWKLRMTELPKSSPPQAKIGHLRPKHSRDSKLDSQKDG